MSIFKSRNISPSFSMLDALKRMDSVDGKLLIIEEYGKYFGLISAGDIQRAIIRGEKLDTNIMTLLRSNLKTANENTSIEEIRKLMFEFRMEFCPVISKKNEILNVVFWDDLFGFQDISPKFSFNLPVVIMAGGLGTRLQPITNVVPKPMIPIGTKSMVEEIFDRFTIYGCNTFYLSVKYKAQMIKFYIESLGLPINVHYIEEPIPLGTGGGLSLLKGNLTETFFVTNCDILIEQDYSEMLNFHRESSNLITIVAALKHVPIPYGIIETDSAGKFITLKEKPELTYKINSGMYILEPEVLKFIPDNTFFHITNLIEEIRMVDGKIGIFPVPQNSWKDVGDWPEYLEAIKRK
jgi:dTDP-glucose pyrophosphorylase